MHRAGLRGGIELRCPLQACHSPSTSLCSPAWKHPDAFLQRCEWRHHSSLFSHSVMSDFATPCAVEHQAPPSFTISLSLLKLMPSNRLILYCHLLLPSIFSASWSFPVSWLLASGGRTIRASTSVLSMNIEVTSFRIDWFDLLAVQRTLKSLLQHHSSKASILRHLGFFMVQLRHL